MDCNITKNNIYSCKTVYENFSEEKVDLDIVIPDYCAAAVRILKCEVQPVISSKTIDGDRLILEGTCTVNVMYADEQTGAVKSIVESAAFTQTQVLKEQLSAYRIKVRLRTSNVSCRLQNSRRISVKAVVGIAAKVMGNAETSVIDSIDDCDIETLFDKVDFCTYAGSGDADIRISAESELSAPVLDVIKCDGCITVGDLKVINDKIIIKGEAVVSCLYTTGETTSDLESTEIVIPFNEIVDVEGAQENSEGEAECEIVSIRCDIGDDSSVISIEVDARATASAYNNLQVNLLKDVYSRASEINVTSSEISIESLYDNMNFTEAVRNSVELDINEARVSDIVLKPVVKNISMGDGTLIIEGDINACIFAANRDEYRFADRSVPFSIEKSFPDTTENLRCEATVCAKNVSCSMPGDTTLEFKADLEFNILVFSNSKYNVIENIEVDEQAQRTCFGSKIVLYYADRGENLWDIAKKYHTSVDVIKRDNTLDDSIVNESKMLLISGN